jgi:translocation and assembly module TamB
MRYTLFPRGRHHGRRRLRMRRPNHRRAGGARRGLLVVLVLLVALVALLPTLVAKTPLRDIVLGRVVPSDTLHVSIGNLSLGWFSPPSASAIEVKDAAGATLLTAESIRIDRTPWALATGRSDLGTVEIVRPTIYVAVRPDGSNVEDAVGQLLAAGQEPATATPAAGAPAAVKFNVVEGLVRVRDMAAGREWRIEQLGVQYDSSGAGRLSVAGRVSEISPAGAAAPAGGFKVMLAPDATGRQQLAWETAGLPLAAAEPWLQRFAAGAALAGVVSGQGTASWTAAPAAFPSDLTTSGQVNIDRLEATAPALGGDRVRLARVELPWRLVADPRGLAIETLALRSDLGQAELRGTLDPATLARGLLDAESRHDVEMRASLDVARLAAMLPHALRIRSDTTITSGIVQFAVRQRPTDGGQTLAGTFGTTQLAATSAGRQFRWDKPVSANFTLRRQAGALRLDALNCDSEFLKISASGTPHEATAHAQFDLDKLAEQLGQFLDLRGMELAGTGTAQFDLRAGSSSTPATGSIPFSATATGDLTQLRVTLADGAVWSEPQLTVEANAVGSLDRATLRPSRLETGQFHLSARAASDVSTAPADELDARLTSPVDMAAASPTYPLSLRATGNIARWLTRARPVFAPAGWQLDGEAELTVAVTVAASAVDASNAKLVMTDLKAASPGWTVNEPRVEVSGDVRWDGTSGRLATKQAQLVTSTVSLATKDVDVRLAEGRVAQLGGAAAFRVDLARLAAWRQSSSQTSPPWQPAGMVTGNLQFAQQGDRITGELAVSGKNLVLSEWQSAGTGRQAGYKTRWLEAELTVRGMTDYQTSADRLALRQLMIQSNTLQAAIDGQVEGLSTVADVNVKGTLNYDLAQVSQLLLPYTGGGVQLTGREQARFALTGRLAPIADLRAGSRAPSAVADGRTPAGAEDRPARGDMQSPAHWSRRASAQIELPWSAANVYGLPVGAGRLSAVLGDGLVRVEPLALAVGEGRVTAAPLVRLDPEPSELTLPAGPLISNVRISPEVSEGMLKYVAPVLAGTTRSEGQFSIQLSGARVPLVEASKADVTGQMTVHSVQVVPGPLAQQWVQLAQQIEAIAKRRDIGALTARPQVSLLSIRDQQVGFRMVDGRVYHDGMEFQSGDVVIRSQGSVGLDETLSLMLFVPIQDKWIEREPLLAGLKGQSLQVPITGTITHPQMDQRAVANLSQQLIQSAAGQAVGTELNKALDKLFKPR